MKNPYSEDIFPMTTEQYAEHIPDNAKRTAISGLLMRKGWEVAVGDIIRIIDEQIDNYTCEFLSDKGSRERRSKYRQRKNALQDLKRELLK